MLYGIIYLFKLSDFLAVAHKHGATWICLSSCWLKENVVKGTDLLVQWTDLHELAFMGAFGMAYKMQIDGEAHVDKVADNNALVRRAKVILTEVQSKWGEQRKGPKRDLLVVPGTLIRMELVEHARVPLQLFLADTIPLYFPVYDLTGQTKQKGVDRANGENL